MDILTAFQEESGKYSIKRIVVAFWTVVISFSYLYAQIMGTGEMPPAWQILTGVFVGGAYMGTELIGRAIKNGGK